MDRSSMHRRTVLSGTEWEEQVGYSRATRVGTVVHVAGTTATDEDGTPIDGTHTSRPFTSSTR
ncbi:hypothetical protein MW046_07245 [Halocatena salina]|uniref:Uncharacterized protein n=1 Tax=Halocatena salina TaxID=2934340 RepID=A0A8U0A5M7_9EURY|nr:hypothetical protein [Halocatena salina]UPM44159.1 hypothetical protein MW046_07245 [Halocatena salina]